MKIIRLNDGKHIGHNKNLWQNNHCRQEDKRYFKEHTSFDNIKKHLKKVLTKYPLDDKINKSLEAMRF